MVSRIRPLYIVLGILALIVIWIWSGYNGLVTAKETVNTAWSNVQTQYQRRFDLVPNLVATVKGAANFEQSTFTDITKARSQWQSATTREGQISAAQGLDGALSKLIVTVEAYPQLQATQAYRDLMTSIEGTENRVGVARMDFNNAALAYNLKVKRFPGNVLAGIFGFSAENLFQNAPGADLAPKVDFTK